MAAPTDADEDSVFFKGLEAVHSKREPGKFGYDIAAAPAIGSQNAGGTQPVSPRPLLASNDR